MARTDVSVTTLLGAYGDYSVANSADLTWQQADTTNDNQVLLREGDILLFWNQGAGAQTVTINSVALYGRTGDITAYSVGVDEIAHFGPVKAAGWKQSDGYLYFEASTNDIYWCVLRAS